MNNTIQMKFYTHKIKIFILTLFIAMISVPNQSVAESDTYEETVSAGNRTFNRFCATCHGQDAKGNGPYAANLKATPTNLTKLANQRNGAFPWSEIYKVIDGRDIATAHGTSEMPIWGDLFNMSDWGKNYAEQSTAITRGRIFELLMYLDFIQAEE